MSQPVHFRIEQSATHGAGQIIDASTGIKNELEFQRTKQYKNRVHEYLSGSTLEGEVSDDMKQIALDSNSNKLSLTLQKKLPS